MAFPKTKDNNLITACICVLFYNIMIVVVALVLYAGYKYTNRLKLVVENDTPVIGSNDVPDHKINNWGYKGYLRVDTLVIHDTVVKYVNVVVHDTLKYLVPQEHDCGKAWIDTNGKNHCGHSVAPTMSGGGLIKTYMCYTCEKEFTSKWITRPDEAVEAR